MARQLLTILDADPEVTESASIPLDDSRLRALYEAITLTRLLDDTCGELHEQGEIGFFVPAGPAAPASAGIALALEPGDWLFPSYRDAAAYLARGGAIETFLAQMLSSTDDPARGRQLPGQGSLPDGLFVAPSGLAGAQIQHAAGAALGMQLSAASQVAVAVFGPAAVEQAAFHAGLNAAIRHDVPAVFVCRSRGTERPTVVQRAAGYGMTTALVDGNDALAVASAIGTARGRAVAGKGPSLIEAVVDPSDSGEGRSRLRAFLQSRGIWDAERDEAFEARCRQRIDEALAGARAAGAPPADSLLDDVWADRPWMLQEQESELEARQDD